MTDVLFGHATDAGRRREGNEDNYAVLPDSGVWILADGMGGHQAGEVASAMAIYSIVASLREGHSPAEAIVRAHADVRASTDANGPGRPMGCTAVVAQIHPDWRYDVHWVGDSRAYGFNGELVQVTHDHTVVHELLIRGALTPEEAAVHPKRHALSRAVGASPTDDLEVDGVDGVLAPGESLLLCSDGLYEYANPEAVLATMRSDLSPQQKCDALVAHALEGGGGDNVTVVLMTRPGRLEPARPVALDPGSADDPTATGRRTEAADADTTRRRPDLPAEPAPVREAPVVAAGGPAVRSESRTEVLTALSTTEQLPVTRVPSRWPLVGGAAAAVLLLLWLLFGGSDDPVDPTRAQAPAAADLKPIKASPPATPAVVAEPSPPPATDVDSVDGADGFEASADPEGGQPVTGAAAGPVDGAAGTAPPDGTVVGPDAGAVPAGQPPADPLADPPADPSAEPGTAAAAAPAPAELPDSVAPPVVAPAVVLDPPDPFRGVRVELPPGVYLQAGAFADVDRAEALRAQLGEGSGFDATIVPVRDGLRGVVVGPFTSREDAELVSRAIQEGMAIKTMVKEF